MSYFRPELEQQLLDTLDGTDQTYADAMAVVYQRRRELAYAKRGPRLTGRAYEQMMAEFSDVLNVLRERWRILGPGGGEGTVSGVYRFTLAGLLEGRAASITWDQGALGGDPEAVWRLVARATELEGQVVWIGDAHETETDHLSHPLSAISLARELLGWDAALTGVFPRIPPPPTGYKR